MAQIPFVYNLIKETQKKGSIINYGKIELNLLKQLFSNYHILVKAL